MIALDQTADVFFQATVDASPYTSSTEAYPDSDNDVELKGTIQLPLPHNYDYLGAIRV